LRVSLQVSDDLYDLYSKHADALASRGQSISAEEIMVSHLDRFSKVRAVDRIVVVDPESLTKIEATLGDGYLKTGEDLATRVQELASLEIGSVRLEFTTKQLFSLKRYATKNGISLEDAVKRTVDSMSTLFFDYVSE